MNDTGKQKRNPKVLCAICGRVVPGMMGSVGEWKPTVHRGPDGLVCVGYFCHNGHRVEVLEDRG